MELSSYALSPLREGQFTLYRGHGDGLAPILLVAAAGEYPSSFALQRLEHEYALRTELDAEWAARPVELLRREVRLMLVLADPGGEPLDGLLGRPMAVAAFLRIAIPLTAAIGQAHARGLIHKDLNPANILVDTTSGSVRLTGFGIASRLPSEHQAPAPPEIIAGTLAYMAPEQTGRMNRSIDSRSDLYALGAIFYEMLTGALPFMAADPMEWVHCHIARQPVPPRERIASIPRPLSAIILKLLAKTADERYQTAAGLTIDLQRCLTEWLATSSIAPFPLGQQDASDRLLIPEKLYGRERETETLLAAFDRVVASGTPELVLVSGYSGIGKSSVVNELHKALVPPRGLFASGKFDQYKRDIPYATLAEAFQSLVRSLLGQSEAELGRWCDDLSEALGPNGQLIVNLVPELELVIGKPPPVPDLPPQDAQNRFQMVFRRFLGAFAKPEHPLALFIDDLQWLDIATLGLLEHLVTHSEVRHLLLVGAYRDNEVGPAHPLLRTLETIRGAGARVQEIVLAPLGRNDVSRLIADALHCEPERARPLVQLVHEKTSGNPFFAIQFLTALAEEGLLALDPVTQAWQWDIDRIRTKSYTDNVVDLMAEKLKRLPATTQEALKQLACLGNVAQITTLTLVRGEKEEAIHAVLWDAVYAGLVVNADHVYKFLHDRIQQAAYSLIPEEQRADVHLCIGRVLASRTAPEDLEEKIFEIVNQLDRGAALILSREERERVAALNLIAGKRAKTSTAYAAALNYLAVGRALLVEDSWERQYELVFSIEYHRAECDLLVADLAAAEERLIMLSRRAGSLVDIAAVACLRLTLYTTIDRSDRSVEVCLEYLQRVGVHWSPHPTKDVVRAEYERIWRQIGNRSIEELVDLPLMSDPECRATLDVLTQVVTPALFTDENLLSLVICRMVNLSLEHGNSDGSCFAFVWFGMILGPHFGDYRAGFRFGTLGYDLVEKRGLHRYQARTYMSLGNLVMPWTKHIQAGRNLVRRAFDAANKIGDSTFAAYSCNNLNTNLLAAGDSLVDAQHEAENGLDFAQKARFGLVVDIITAQLGLIRTLRGLTSEFGSFNDEMFNESRFEHHLQSDPRLALPECWYWVRKLQARVYANDYNSAIEAASKAQQLLWTSPSFFEVAEYHFYDALARAGHYDAASAAERVQHLEALTAHHKQLEVWAENCPENFTNRVSLVAAEIARLEGRALDAMHFYEQAVQAAREHGFVQNEGLAYEISARFYAARGYETFANAYLRNARYCYLRWGALGKVRQLEQLHPQLLEDASPRPPAATAGTSLEQLDIGAVVKASQAVSGEIVLDRLTETLMTIALEHAGAERGLLLFLRGEVLQIEAEAKTADKTIEVTLRQAPVTPAALPEAVLHTVIRTQHSVLLDDASAPNPFAGDAYVRQTHARSVLCLPLVKQAKLIGVLYLENNLASHVFTPARTSVLELLASQAAISLENARLYADLRLSEERWRNLFESVPVGMTLTGSHGRYVAVNPAFQKMTGYSEAELRNLSPVDITHEDDRAASEALVAARAAGIPYLQRIEKRYRGKDGGVIWVDASAFVAPVVAGAPLFPVVVVDITDRKRAETALRRSEAYLTEAQRLSRTGSFGWNVSRGDIFWSEESFDIYGYDTALSANIEMVLQRVHPEDLALVQRIIEHASSTGRNCDFEHRLLMPDGAVRYVHVVGRAVRDQADELEFIGSVMDVTAAKRAEESLHKAQADLAHATRVTTLGELAASIAHEINQPLTAVATSGNACLRWLNRDPPDFNAARQAVARIVQDAHRAGDVIHSLRALAVKSGPQFTKLDLNGAMQEVLALTRSDLQRHGVALHTDLSAHLHPVMADRVQVQQVLLNLIMNGMDAMADVTDRSKMLAISAKPAQPDGVLIGVEDTGTGFDPAAADQIFAPFYTTKSSGMGMGLSICKTIIEAHGGQLWAKPNLPNGAIFLFRLPADGREVS
jgi:PAS domain S-box-containing protein